MKFVLKVELPAERTTAMKIIPIMIARTVQYLTMAPESLVLPATMTPVRRMNAAAIQKVAL